MPFTKLFYSQELDADLFWLVNQDDAKAFEELYNRYWPGLINAAYKRLHSKEEAEGIVQNIFVNLFQTRATIESTISISDYLNEALKFKILKEYRSQIEIGKHQKDFF